MDPRAKASAGVNRAQHIASDSNELRRYRELSNRLFGEDPGPLGPPSNIEFLRVTVHRARNLSYGAVEYRAPQVMVTINQTRRNTPKGKAYGVNPIFDWSSDFRVHGEETHIIFELYCGVRQMGQAYVPLTPVRQAGSLRRVLPLMRHGIIAGLEGEGGERCELIVSVECIAGAQPGGGVRELPRIQEARKQCKQVRITVRSIEIKIKEYSDLDASSLNPCVEVTLGGPQKAATPIAFRSQKTEADEFVFIHPNRMCDCGGMMRGRNEYYEPPPMPPLSGSQAMKGYRKIAGDILKVVYRDVNNVFWYTEQEYVEFKVVDDHVLTPDIQLVVAMIDISDLFAAAYGAGSGDLRGVAATGPMRRPLEPLDMHLKDYDNAVKEVGEIEFEAEFFQDAIGCPSNFEPLYRRLGQMRRESQDKHYEALSAVDEVVRGRSLDNILQAVPMDVRQSFADMVAGSMIVSIRKVVRHEEDGHFCQERISKACQELGLILQFSSAVVAEYDNLARTATPMFSLERQAQRYNERCSQIPIHPLLLPLAIIAELMRQRDGYGATVRCAIRDSLQALGEGQYDGDHVFGLLERFVLKTLPGVRLPSFPRIDKRCLTAKEILELSSEPLQAEMQPTHEELIEGITEAKKEVGKFLPTIDPSRLVNTVTHPGEVLLVAKDTKRTLLAGSLTMGFVAGIAGGFGVQKTAQLIHGMDDQFFCNPKYQTWTGINKAICRFLKETPADEMIANYLGTNKGFITFFWIYFVLFSWGTYNRLKNRFARLHELALEPMNQSASPHAMICISGFLMNRADQFVPWQTSDKYPWTDAQIYAVRFETDALLQLGDTFNSAMAKLAKQTADAINLGFAFTNPVSLSQQLITNISTEIADIFDLVCRRAWEAGKYLCNALLSTALAEQDLDYDAENSDEEGRAEPIRPARTVSLCGYSTGCIIIQSCLIELQKISESVDPRAPLAADLICDVVFVGAPVVGNTEEFSALRRLVNGRFVNGYVSSDKDLVGRQVRRGFRLFAGCNSYCTVPGIENIPLNEFINIHAHYHMQMPAILMKIFHGQS